MIGLVSFAPQFFKLSCKFSLVLNWALDTSVFG